MIKPDARLSIAKIPLEKIQIRGFQQRHAERVEHYTRLLENNPDDYPGMLLVAPSENVEGMFLLLDDIALFAVSVVAGKPDILCVVIEEPEQDDPESETSVTKLEKVEEPA